MRSTITRSTDISPRSNRNSNLSSNRSQNSRSKIAAAAGCTAAVLAVSGGIALAGQATASASVAGVTHHSAAHRHDPVGYLDRISISNHTVTLRGWTYDPDSASAPIRVAVRSDGRRVVTARTSLARPDVERYYHRSISRPGFVVSFWAPYATHNVCVSGVNARRGSTARLTCQRITVRDPHRPRGTAHFSVNRSARTITVSGAAFDPDAPSAAIQVAVSATGHQSARVTARSASAAFDRRFGVTGRHGYGKTVSFGYGTARVCARALNVGAGSVSPLLGCKTVTFARPSSLRPSSTGQGKGQKIATMARSFVGHVRYATAGTTPRTGFDCSGLTRYVYSKQHISLDHSADRQYHRFRKVAKASARPGDLVFFLSGGRAYHVAVYQGKNMIVAAATYGEGIKYQKIWSSNVKFGTVLH